MKQLSPFSHQHCGRMQSPPSTRPAVAALTLCAALLAGCSSSAPTAAPHTSADASTPRASAAAAAGAQAKAARVETDAPKSVFHAGPQAGRDPFFAASTPTLAAATETAAPARLPLVSYLKLGGTRFGTTRPMALINRTPLAQGEEADVSVVIPNPSSKPEVQKVAIRCVEVRRDSVLISIAGEQGVKELRMAQAK